MYILCAALMAIVLPAYSQTGLPDSVLQHVVDKNHLPSGSYTLYQTWSFSDFSHKVGKEVSDPDASGGKAWEASIEHGDDTDFLLYGPYAQIPEGDYVALVSIDPLQDAQGGPVASVESCTNYGENMLNQVTIFSSGMKTGSYSLVPLAFHDPGGKLEIRLRWTGQVDIRTDRVLLYRVEGADMSHVVMRVPQPQYSGKPNNLLPNTEPRPYPDIFPRSSAPASTLYIADLRHVPSDMKVVALSIEGLVNRKKPQIYTIYQDSDVNWLDWMKKKGWIHQSETVIVPDLLKRFRSYIKGVVITDPALPATKNVATMVASVKDGLVVSPRLAKSLGLPVLMDLRGKWKESADAYRWSFNTLWPKLTHHVTACIYPDHDGLRDYLIENKVFCFWISGPIDGAQPGNNPDAETHLMEQLFAKMPVNCPVMSYPWAAKDVGIGEGPGVTLFAQFAKYLVGSIDLTNLSVHSGIHGLKFQQRTPPPAPKLNKSRVYASFIISDGDNLPVLTNYNFPVLWKSPIRGTLPLGWTISPSSSMLIPDVVNYYYSTASPDDCFVTAVSGIGYTYPDSYGERYRKPYNTSLFEGFLGQTREYMKRMDCNVIWPMNVTKRQTISLYAQYIPFLKAIFPDYGRRVATYQDAVFPVARDVPVFRAVNGWQENATTEEQVNRVVAEVHSMTPSSRPAFLHIFIWNWGFSLEMLKSIADKLGPDYQIVRPDQLAELYHSAMGVQKISVNAPQDIYVVGKDPVTFQISMQNISGKAYTPLLKVQSGLRNAHIPVSRTLAANAERKLTITGIPEKEKLHLTISADGKTIPYLISVQSIPKEEILPGLPHARLQFVAKYSMIALSHLVGNSRLSKQGDVLWHAEAGKDAAGTLCFGPYSDLPPGRYVALYRVRRTSEGDGKFITVDTCVGGGKIIDASKDILGADVPEGEFRYIPLVFKHPGGQIETRITWPGDISLDVESVSLWKIL
jgi:hypothetical protein